MWSSFSLVWDKSYQLSQPFVYSNYTELRCQAGNEDMAVGDSRKKKKKNRTLSVLSPPGRRIYKAVSKYNRFHVWHLTLKTSFSFHKNNSSCCRVAAVRFQKDVWREWTDKVKKNKSKITALFVNCQNMISVHINISSVSHCWASGLEFINKKLKLKTIYSAMP